MKVLKDTTHPTPVKNLTDTRRFNVIIQIQNYYFMCNSLTYLIFSTFSF